MSKINIGILAAGSSTRLGKTKQLIVYNGKSLIEHVAHTALNLNANQLFCITGHDAIEIQNQLGTTDVQCIYNDQHETGMSSSILQLLKAVSTQKNANSLMVLLCDQPLIPFSHFQDLIKLHTENPAKIIVTDLGDTLSPPVIFPNLYLDKLAECIKSGNSAKAFIKEHLADAMFLGCEEANYDIDTEQDLKEHLNIDL